MAVGALGHRRHLNALRARRAGGTLSSLGVYSGKLSVPPEHSRPGWASTRSSPRFCLGGKERVHRLMELMRHDRLDLRPLLTYTFSFDQITDAYALFGKRRDVVIKVAIRP